MGRKTQADLSWTVGNKNVGAKNIQHLYYNVPRINKLINTTLKETTLMLVDY